MDEEPLHLIGVVTNVDETILSLDLGDDLHAEEWRLSELVPLIAKLEFLAEHEVLARFRGKYGCVTIADHVYTIEGDVVLPRMSRHSSTAETAARKEADERAVGRIEQEVERMQLFKDSSIDLVAVYLYRGTHETAEFLLARTAKNFAEPSGTNNIFAVTSAEIDAYKSFRTAHAVSFRHPYVALAYRNFMQSYRTDDLQLKFLLLMIGLEVIFNVAPQELTYRVSRGVAVLLSRTKTEGAQLFKDMKRLYKIRSDIVHTGDSAFSLDDVFMLRSLLRRAVVCAAAIDCSKNDLAERITASGYGALQPAT